MNKESNKNRYALCQRIQSQRSRTEQKITEKGAWRMMTENILYLDEQGCPCDDYRDIHEAIEETTKMLLSMTKMLFKNLSIFLLLLEIS